MKPRSKRNADCFNVKGWPFTMSTRAGSRTLRATLRLLVKAAAERDDPELAALVEKTRSQWEDLQKFLAEAEAYGSTELARREKEAVAAFRSDWGGRLLRVEIRQAVCRELGGLMTHLLPWVLGAGQDRARKEASARRTALVRNEEIASAAEALLLLLRKNAASPFLTGELPPDHFPFGIAIPHLENNLQRLVELASGNGQRWQPAINPLAKGAEGFVTDMDRVLPFRLTSGAMMNLWTFVSGGFITESAVRAARKRSADRTNLS